MLEYTGYGKNHSEVLLEIQKDLNNSKNRSLYEFNQDPKGREKLRRRLRAFHGFSGTDKYANPKACLPNSPMQHLLNNKNLWITNDGWILKEGDKLKKKQEVVSIIESKDVKERQDNVQIYYDPNKISPKEICDIQILKKGEKKGEIITPKSMTKSEYINKLEELASYVVVRGEVKQLYAMDKDASVLKQPRERVLYYANFPKLQGNHSLDVIKFTEVDPMFHNSRNGNGNRRIKEVEIGNLKNKFKDVLRLQIMVAAKNNEGLDVVTPNAFFYALTPQEQEHAKELFATAVVEVSSEQEYPGFVGLFVHNSFGMNDKMIAAQESLQIPVIVHNGDASSPQLSATSKGLFNVAESIMGEACGAVGNGALSDRAEQAKEENDTRMMGGYNELVFGPKWNTNLLQENNYKSLEATGVSDTNNYKKQDVENAFVAAHMHNMQESMNAFSMDNSSAERHVKPQEEKHDVLFAVNNMTRHDVV